MKRKIKNYILLCGIIIFTWTSLCHGQSVENKHPLAVKMPEAKTPPHLLPENLAPPTPAEAKQPEKKATKKGWYWQLLEWTAINFAVFNTMKQSDGRPNVPGKSQ